nr:glycoside hydrolase family 99-like domain-containing protein [Dendrosporobacter quercicolus]
MNLIRSASEKSKDFIDDDPYLKVDLTEQDVKLIAFYLPQFHSIPENDSWWEKGFTEWTNVTKTVPQYNGHYQPHFPTDLGFYDLRNIGIMKRQVEMAKQYGIYGFCFYHYWFAGQRLLETPVNNFLKHKELVYPFCLCWANENWTRRWDGLENEILISQNHSEEDDLAFIEDAARYFKSKRYIKIQGRPLFIVYRPLLFPDPEKTIKIWKEYCRQMDIGDLFVAGIKGFGLEQNDIYGLDALIEFPPFGFYSQDITDSVMLMNSNFSGAIYDYNFCINKDYLHKEKGLIFRGVMPGWDNTARRPDAATIFHDSCPEKYQNWLENAIRFTKDKLPNEQQFIFVNAWNEWAEGAHLEPDRKYGYGNLHATAKALIKSRTRE